MTPQEKARRKLQSEIDRQRRNNIVRATETYAQTKARILRQLQAWAEARKET